MANATLKAFFGAATGTVFKTEKLAGQSVFPNSDLFIDNLLTQACKPDYSVDDIFRRDSHRQAATSYAKFRELTRLRTKRSRSLPPPYQRQKKPIQ
jgi:hypothetical protein